MELVIINLPKNKSLGPEVFTGKFYQTLEEDLKPILLKFFQKIEEKGMLSNSFYEANITLIPKLDKDVKRKLSASVCDEHRCKSPQKYTTKLNPSV